MFEIEKSRLGDFIVASDEVGRGCLAWAVVCASTIVSEYSSLKQVLSKLKALSVTDSKKLTPTKIRDITTNIFGTDFMSLIESAKVSSKNNYHYIIESTLGIDSCISVVSPRVIDQKNILQASLFGMRSSGERLISKTKQSKGVWLVDGNRIWHRKNKLNCELIPVVSGDSKSLLIGVSSVIAKDFRDSLMKKIAKKYPEYGFEDHFGYPTRKHKNALKKYGTIALQS